MGLFRFGIFAIYHNVVPMGLYQFELLACHNNVVPMKFFRIGLFALYHKVVAVGVIGKSEKSFSYNKLVHQIF